jgi:hypothetical protein
MPAGRFVRVLALLTATLLAGVATAVASPLALRVNVDTSALVGLGPFALDFQLIDGQGLGDGSTTLILDDFSFGGGTALGGAMLFGGASGDVDTGVTLTDSSFFNEFRQDFLAGGLLSFRILSAFIPAQDPPDLFTLAILDGDGFEIPTFGFANEFLSIAFDGGPSIGVFGSDLNLTAHDIPAPELVPEPGSLMLLGSGVAALLARRVRRRR